MVIKGAHNEERSQFANALSTAKENLNNAKSNYDRFKVLFDKGGISKQQMDGIELQYQVAQKQYDFGS